MRKLSGHAHRFSAIVGFGLFVLAGGLAAWSIGWLLDGPAKAGITEVATAPPERLNGARVRYDTGGLVESPDTVRSVLNTKEALHFGNYVWDEEGVLAGPVHIRVDLRRQLLSVFRGGHEIGSTLILYGSDSKQTSSGRFTVLEKVVDYHSRTYDAPMPYMMRLTSDGIAIHASDVREGWATHGCIGVPMAFAERLFALVKEGDMVTILPEKTDVAQIEPSIGQ